MATCSHDVPQPVFRLMSSGANLIANSSNNVLSNNALELTADGVSGVFMGFGSAVSELGRSAKASNDLE